MLVCTNATKDQGEIINDETGCCFTTSGTPHFSILPDQLPGLIAALAAEGINYRYKDENGNIVEG